jgi:hypothetical protein
MSNKPMLAEKEHDQKFDDGIRKILQLKEERTREEIIVKFKVQGGMVRTVKVESVL